MLSYEIDEAIELLREKLDTAKRNLHVANEDLGYLRDQITTMEVNTARVHNWDVKRRRERCVQSQAYLTQSQHGELACVTRADFCSTLLYDRPHVWRLWRPFATFSHVDGDGRSACAAAPAFDAWLAAAFFYRLCIYWEARRGAWRAPAAQEQKADAWPVAGQGPRAQRQELVARAASAACVSEPAFSRIKGTGEVAADAASARGFAAVGYFSSQSGARLGRQHACVHLCPTLTQA